MLTLVPDAIEAYALAHTSAVPDLLEELRVYTHEHMNLPQLQVGPIEGHFLQLLAKLARAQRIIEVGTFTGYSALMMAAALPENGSLITCDIDPKAAEVARSFFQRSPHGHKIELALGPAAETLAKLEGPFDMAFIDADKVGYIQYFDLILPLMRPGGLIVADNVLWSGKVLQDETEREESTQAIVNFNRHIQRLVDHQKVMLTVRDGMFLILT